MALYSLLITHLPSDVSQTITAQRFATQLVEQGHTVQNVFFYGDGTYHASAMVQIPSDEHQSYSQWKYVQQATGCSLLVCVTAAIKRGIVGDMEAREADMQMVNLEAPFEQAGLGEFFTQLHHCQHLVQF